MNVNIPYVYVQNLGKHSFGLMTEKEHHISSDMQLVRDLVKSNTIPNGQGH